MKKFLHVVIFGVISVSLAAQSPQGFNYQAVARDAEGNVLTETVLNVRLGIYNDDELTWQEEHTVETNAHGLFSLIIGDEMASNTGGSAATFSHINWGSGNFELEVSIDNGSGFIAMGRSGLMSVPFAMYAQNGPGDEDGDPENELQDLRYVDGVLGLTKDPTPNGINLSNVIAAEQAWNLNSDTIYTPSSVGIGTDEPNQSLLAIQSGDPQVEKPLFEVRNDLGNPVFAVFNDGVMVYVDEEKKGVKGGFAVGGYNSSSKGVSQEYLRITPDSVRIYVPDKPATKGVKGGFAVGGYNSSSKAPSFNFLEVNSSETNIQFDTTNQAKAIKGGFAVGGYNSAGKAEPTQLMSLTPQNYLIGENAGASITTGKNNSFLGYQAGMSTTTGYNNIFLGKRAGHSAVNALENIFLGNGSGYNTVSGYGNVFLGNQAGLQNQAGYYNSFVGYQAGYASTAFYNTFFGYQAGYHNTSGKNNIAIGYRAGYGFPENGDGVTGGSNIFIGLTAGYRNSTGANNIFMGTSSGVQNTVGQNNIFIGNASGSNTEDGNYNTYIGYRSGYQAGNGVTGDPSYNTFVGYQTGYNNRTGQYNTYIGYNAGFSGSNASGSNNVIIGDNAGSDNTTGSNNVFLGNSAGANNLSGNSNVFIGQTAGFANQHGDYNTFIGYQAGYSLTGGANNWEGAFNTILGYQAGHDILKGYKNVLIGYQAGYKIRDNRYNIIIGEGAGYNLEGVLGNTGIGQSNLLLGLFSGYALTTGSSNIFLGLDVGYACAPDAVDNVWIGLAAGRASASSGSVFLGKYAGYNEDSDNKLIIQTNYTGSDNLNNALVYGDFSTDDLRFNATIGINRNDSESYGLMVDGGSSSVYSMIVYKGAYAYGNGFVSASDASLKSNVGEIENALGLVKSLHGVTFDWKDADTSVPGSQVGLIAQEVEEVLPQLVTENEEGLKGVAYDKLTAVLIEAVKEQQQQIENLKTENSSYREMISRIAEMEQRIATLESEGK